MNLESLPAPYNIVLNSKDDLSTSYTVVNGEGDTNITSEKICFYGKNGISGDKETKEFGGYQKHLFIYESSKGGTITECEMLNNGTYDLIITDGEGNYHTLTIELKNEYLLYRHTEVRFKQPNDILLQQYTNYENVAKADKEITIVSAEGEPIVSRKDINGTITLYDILYNFDYLENFFIEVKPYDEDKEIDGYNKKGGNFIVNVNQDGYKFYIDEDGKVVIENDKSPFIEVTTYGSGDNKMPCYVIKCPKGDVDYSVRVTQVCKKNGVWEKTKNYVEEKIRVEQPQPYKLYINGVDYDVIKNFKTGWSLSTEKGMQTRNGYGPLPFNNVGKVGEIRGWNDMGNIGSNSLYDWSVDEKFYGKNYYGEGYKPFDLYYDDDKNVYRYNIEDEYDVVLEKISKHKEGEPIEPVEPVEPIEPPIEMKDEHKKWEEDYAKWVTNHNEWLTKHNEWLTKHNEWESKLLELEKEVTAVEDKLQILSNRLEFVDKMKEAFWLLCDGEFKTISYQVTTDSNPIDVWSMYNPEYLSEDEYPLLESEYGKTGWRYVGNNETNVADIRIPTLTCHESVEYGDGGDNSGGTMCFAQDNLAEGIANVSIKPPYLIAAVNADGVTKPYGLPSGKFFTETTNQYGLKKNIFGSGEGYVNDGTNEFFGFHIIDKIFGANFTCWSYINNVPQFLPYIKYDSENPFPRGFVDCEGIISMELRNGLTKSSGYVDDFDIQEIFNREVSVKTFDGSTEFDIPTKRCVIVGKNVTEIPEENGVYTLMDSAYPKGYHITDKEYQILPVFYKKKCKKVEEEFYWVVKAEFEDGGIKYSIDEHIYIETYNKLSSDNKARCENQPWEIIEAFTTDKLISVSGGRVTQSTILPYQNYRFTDKVSDKEQYALVYNGTGKYTMADMGSQCQIEDNLYGGMRIVLTNGYSSSDASQNVLNVTCFSGDTNDPMTYYLFKVSKKNDKDSQSLVYYPINAFKDNVLMCNGNMAKWDGSNANAAQLFNRNTKISDLETLKVAENEDGKFEVKDSGAYCVITVTKNDCRTISPVYDYTPIYYAIGLVDYGFKKMVRFALVNVIDVNTYLPNNYYLTQYNFDCNYSFTGVEKSGGILSWFTEKTHSDGSTKYTYGEEKKFLNEENFYDKAKIGDAYLKDNTIYTRVVGKIHEISDRDTFISKSGVGQKYDEKYGKGEWSKLPIDAPNGQPSQNKYIFDNFSLEVGKKYSNKIPTDVNAYQIFEWKTENATAACEISYDDKAYTPISDGYYVIKWTYMNPMSGMMTMVKYFQYSTKEVSEYKYTSPNSPKAPYFADYKEKNISDDEYDSIKNTLSSNEKDKYLTLNIKDVVGVTHKCVFEDVIEWDENNFNKTWYDLITKRWHIN